MFNCSSCIKESHIELWKKRNAIIRILLAAKPAIYVSNSHHVFSDISIKRYYGF